MAWEWELDVAGGLGTIGLALALSYKRESGFNHLPTTKRRPGNEGGEER